MDTTDTLNHNTITANLIQSNSNKIRLSLKNIKSNKQNIEPEEEIIESKPTSKQYTKKTNNSNGKQNNLSYLFFITKIL